MRTASYSEPWDLEGNDLDPENLAVAHQMGVDTKVDNLAEGNDTSKEEKVDTLGVVIALGVLELGFVLLVRQQNPRLLSLVVSYKPWRQNEWSAVVLEG